MKRMIRFDELRRGQVYARGCAPEDLQICLADIAYEDPSTVYLHGMARQLEVPGLEVIHTPFVFDDLLFIGCQKCSLEDAFQALYAARLELISTDRVRWIPEGQG